MIIGKLVKIKSGYHSTDNICLVITDSEYTNQRKYYLDKESKSVKHTSMITSYCFVYDAHSNKIFKVDLRDIAYI